jgi:TrmH family RNA methyltransferase
MPPASQRIPSRIVQSRQNSRVKELRASFSPGHRPGRDRLGGLVGIEGEHLLVEAARSGVRIATVFFRSGDEALLERIWDRIGLDAGVEIIELPPEVFLSAVTTESPQGIAALIEPRTFQLGDILGGRAPLLVIAAGLQDPGNLGTLVRSAEAFGASGVVTLPGTVSLWNAKALRASSGSAFRLPVVAEVEGEVFPLLRAAEVRVLAAVADYGAAASESDLRVPTAMLIGNEGSGLPRSLIECADGRITIPCPGPVESLNAAVAASILLYEASRQRGPARVAPDENGSGIEIDPAIRAGRPAGIQEMRRLKGKA